MFPLLKEAGPRLRRIGVAFVALTFVAATAVHAQSVNGRILGSVHDQQDAAVAGARVTVTDTLRNISHATVTDDAGDYVVDDLQPSTYKVVVEAQGFNGFQAQSVPVEVGKDVRVDATLKAGDSNPSEFRNGVELIYRQFQDVLQKVGVQPIAAVGQPFDPRIHEAIEMVDTTAVPDHHVLEELQRGYNYKERLLRPAMVRVARNGRG